MFALKLLQYLYWNILEYSPEDKKILKNISFCSISPQNVIFKSILSRCFTLGLEYIRLLIETWASNIFEYYFV